MWRRGVRGRMEPLRDGATRFPSAPAPIHRRCALRVFQWDGSPEAPGRSLLINQCPLLGRGSQPGEFFTSEAPKNFILLLPGMLWSIITVLSLLSTSDTLPYSRGACYSGKTTCPKVPPKHDASPNHLLEVPASLHQLKREPRLLTLASDVAFRHVTLGGID